MRTVIRIFILAVAATVLSPGAAVAQPSPSLRGLADVILQLSRRVGPDSQSIDDQLFSGHLNATVLDRDGNNTNFDGADVVALALASVRSGTTPLVFSGTREQFNRWVEDKRIDILKILFPGSLTESTSGIDAAQAHQQSFLISTILTAGRASFGGRIEYEDFSVERQTGKAVQGLFRAKAATVEARFARLDDTLRTNSINVGGNVHPSWGRTTSDGEWRVGVDGFVNGLYSKSTQLRLGSLDYGGGFWAGGRRAIGRVSVSGGGILLGSKTHVPLGFITDSFEFIARTLNDRDIRWDFTYGGAAQYALGQGWAVGGKALQSASVKSPTGLGRTSQLLLADVAHSIASDRSIDFGYRYSKAGSNFEAHALFANAVFDF